MDFDEKYKDYTGTFLLNQKVKSKKDAERKREVTNGQLPTNRQNGDMWVNCFFYILAEKGRTKFKTIGMRGQH